MDHQEKAKKCLTNIFDSPLVEYKLELLKVNYNLLTSLNQFESNQENESNAFLSSFLNLTILIKNKEYQKAKEIIEPLKTELYGQKRKFDFIYSKIISYFYLIKTNERNLNNINFFFNILASNKENSNKECVSVLTNIVLDYLIKNCLFKECFIYFGNEILGSDEQSFNFYYKGRVFLVSGEYKKSAENFQKAMLLGNEKVFINYVEKFYIVCLLMTSDLGTLKKYKWKKDLCIFYELFECVKSGNTKLFDEAMKRNKEMYKKYFVYAILKRLYRNVVQEGMRKVGMCYSRISLEDISYLLNVDLENVEYLVLRSIAEERIKGKLKEYVFYGKECENEEIDYIGRIKNVFDSYDCMKKMMRFPKIKPLSYENIDKNSIAYDFTN
ncbi:26S proteasome non-ATPase regulatory subunit 3 [Gurleya vavrai]